MDLTKYLREEKLIHDLELEQEAFFSPEPWLNVTSLAARKTFKLYKREEDPFYFPFEKIKNKDKKLKEAIKFIDSEN